MTEQEEEYCFYHEVGFALMQWSLVESAMQSIALRCNQDFSSGMQLAIGLKSIENFRSKLAYLDALLQKKLAKKPDLLREWGALQKRIVACSKHRNAIAHRQATKIAGAKPGHRIALLENGWIFDDAKSAMHEKLTIRDVVERRNEFAALYRASENFCCALSGDPMPFPESHEPANHRMTIRAIETRMREAFGRQPPPSRKKSGV